MAQTEMSLAAEAGEPSQNSLLFVAVSFNILLFHCTLEKYKTLINTRALQLVVPGCEEADLTPKIFWEGLGGLSWVRRAPLSEREKYVGIACQFPEAPG